jgi:hypothetical protein
MRQNKRPWLNTCPRLKTPPKNPVTTPVTSPPSEAVKAAPKLPPVPMKVARNAEVAPIQPPMIAARTAVAATVETAAVAVPVSPLVTAVPTGANQPTETAVDRAVDIPDKYFCLICRIYHRLWNWIDLYRHFQDVIALKRSSSQVPT